MKLILRFNETLNQLMETIFVGLFSPTVNSHVEWTNHTYVHESWSYIYIVCRKE